MDYNWCHGPLCHKRNTTNRVRGVKGSKVLRTIKIALNGYKIIQFGNIFVIKLVCMILLEHM